MHAEEGGKTAQRVSLGIVLEALWASGPIKWCPDLLLDWEKPSHDRINQVVSTDSPFNEENSLKLGVNWIRDAKCIETTQFDDIRK